MNNDNARLKIIEKLKSANNILVTVGHNPSVDTLAAALGLALAIDKMRKHTSAIFSGDMPNFMNFLHPEKIFEDSTASFQDFIISLDKEKADKLRYKVEGDLVKIFITPYHTRISPDDLVFSEGGLNVDLVIALGVKRQEDLDKAVVAHGRILHDADIATINLAGDSSLGTISWSNIGVSGYSEAVAALIDEIDPELFTKQVSTALLTGIVLSTDQFSNVSTKPSTMAIASKLLSNGADQQLIVAEVRSGDTVELTASDITHEIPTGEPANIVPAVSGGSIIPELEALPSVEPADIESVESSLDPYMPPPLPDFSKPGHNTSVAIPTPETLATMPMYDPVPSAIFPEPESEPEPKTESASHSAMTLPTVAPAIKNDPSQFVIPT